MAEKELAIISNDIVKAAKDYLEATSLPKEALTSVLSMVKNHYGLLELIKYQRRLKPDKRKSFIGVSPGRVITDAKLVEIDDFVKLNGFPYNTLYIARDGNIAIRASGWRMKSQADPRCFKGWEKQPIQRTELSNGNVLFEVEVTAIFWTGEKYPAYGAADVNEVQSRRTSTEAAPSFVAMIAETRAKTRALRDALGLPFEVAEDVMLITETRYEAPVTGEGEITSAAELLARASREFSLRRKDILEILEVSSLGEITDLNKAWTKIKENKGATDRPEGAKEAKGNAG